MKKITIIIISILCTASFYLQSQTKVRYLQVEENNRTTRIVVDNETPYSVKTELNSNKQLVINVYKGNVLIANYPEGTKIYPKEEIHENTNSVIEFPDSIIPGNIKIFESGGNIKDINPDGTFNTQSNQVIAIDDNKRIVYFTYNSFDTIPYQDATVLNSLETATSILLYTIPYIFEPTSSQRLKEVKDLISAMPETQQLADAIQNSIKSRGYLEINDLTQQLIAAANVIYAQSGFTDFLTKFQNQDMQKTKLRATTPDYSKRTNDIRLDRNTAILDNFANVWHCKYTAYSDYSCYISIVGGTKDNNGYAKAKANSNYLRYLLPPMNVSKFLGNLSSWSAQKQYWTDTWLVISGQQGIADMTFDMTKCENIEIDHSSSNDVIMFISPHDNFSLLIYNYTMALFKPAIQLISGKIGENGGSKDDVGVDITLGFCEKMAKDDGFMRQIINKELSQKEIIEKLCDNFQDYIISYLATKLFPNVLSSMADDALQTVLDLNSDLLKWIKLIGDPLMQIASMELFKSFYFTTDLPLIITASVNGTGGSITPSGEQQYEEGSDATFDITAHSGYEIDKVLVDGIDRANEVSFGQYIFKSVTENHTITVSFKEIPPVINYHTITAFASTGGKIDPSGEVPVEDGKDQKFTFTPNDGYEIAYVLIDEHNNPSAVAAGEYTFPSVTDNHTITVTFKEIVITPTPTLSVSPSSLILPASGGTQSFDIISNTNWTVSSDASWVTVSPISGSNNSSITVTVDANTGTSQRAATITVSGTDVSAQTVSVTQAAQNNTENGPAITLNSNHLSSPEDNLVITGTGFTPNGYAAINVYNQYLTMGNKDRVPINSNGTFTKTYTALGYRVESAFAHVYVADMTLAGIPDDAWSYTDLQSISSDFVLHETVTIGENINDEQGVVINGIRWATRNVDVPGTFAANPEDAGMFYQWNRKVGWSATDPMVNSNGGTVWDNTCSIILGTGTEWEKENDPSPTGWRIPNINEIETLSATDKVDNEWTTVNGVYGKKFTDKTSGKSIFIPAVGYRDYGGGLLQSVTIGWYWSSSSFSSTMAYDVILYNASPRKFNDLRSAGFSVRCVAE